MAQEMLQRAGGLFSEFRRFALKGNAFELAVAVVVGNAFTGVVNSLVGDVITPFLGLITGNVDLKTLALSIPPPPGTSAGPAIIKYGALLQNVFNFILVALALFLVFKLLSMARERFIKRGGEAATPVYEKPAQERLLEEIRDLLKDPKPRPSGEKVAAER